MKVTTYRRVADIPSSIIIQLHTLCWDKKLGFMKSMLVERLWKARWVTVITDKLKVVAWALVGDGAKAHCWTAREYRGQGYGPLVLGHLMAAVPDNVCKKLKMFDIKAVQYFDIGRYLYLNNKLALT